MDKNQEEADVNLDLPEVKEGETDTTDWKAEATKLREKAIAQRERTKALKDQLKALTPAEKKAEQGQSKTDDNQLLEKAFLRSAQITAADEVELALTIAKKWDMSIDKLVDDDDFKVKLDKMRTQKSNELATSNIKGSQGKGQTKDTPEYWIAKGTPPTSADVPDRATRAKIARAMLASAKNNGKTFYND